jgi:hypothetical protein
MLHKIKERRIKVAEGLDYMAQGTQPLTQRIDPSYRRRSLPNQSDRSFGHFPIGGQSERAA